MSSGRPDSQMITVCGRAVAVTIAGSGEPLLLLHGLGGTRATWRHLIDALAKSYLVIAPDLAGHGESEDAGGDVSLGAQANNLRDLLVALGHHRVNVIGHSLGGGVAMQFAYQFPERVNRLVLIGSGGLGPELTVMLRAATLPGSQTIVAGLAQLPGWLTRRLIPALSALTGCVSRHDCDAVSDALVGLRHAGRRRNFVATARGVINWKGQTIGAARQLSQLGPVPVLALWGSDDKTIPPSHQRSIAEHVPEAKLIEICGAGHFPHETHSAEVLAAVTDFLQPSPTVYTVAPPALSAPRPRLAAAAV